jgi:hypothetical protein
MKIQLQIALNDHYDAFYCRIVDLRGHFLEKQLVESSCSNCSCIGGTYLIIKIYLFGFKIYSTHCWKSFYFYFKMILSFFSWTASWFGYTTIYKQSKTESIMF